MSNFVVAGVRLTDTQQRWVEYVAQKVLGPATRYYGSRSKALDRVAAVTWWSLKEGIMNLKNPLAYSNCHYPGGDRHIGALSSCPYTVWQVGLSGVQANYTSTSKFESIARKTFPGQSITTVLRNAASEAGQSPSRVASTSGRLRRSWLARSAPVGFIREWDYVYPECIRSDRSWCHGSWYPSRYFARNKTVATRVRSSLRSLLAKNACPLVSGAEHELFKDMPRGSFGYSAAKKLYPNITKGCMTSPCRAFCPKSKVTRGQMAAFLTRAKGWGPLRPSTPSFSDVPKSHTFYGAIERIYAKKITNGCGSGKFCPARAITRGELAVFLVRALGLKPLEPTVASFSDVPKSHMFYGAIERFAAEGITKGCGSGKFCPDRTLSRAELAIFLVRAFRL